MASNHQSGFQDFLPVMAEKLGGEDDDLLSMLKEGDFDGDGALDQMEFCVLMFRLSPDLMEESQFLLQEALDQEIINHL
ncbi:hypothetical protein E3N88_34805 [Mikania micrantha]|uniref:EF-hand domain-containing protein n=1 Tax=Mikania micrantha TaxID=192012 RepID=A0A5N6LZ71_9ASTR|nr:hypothetical protein E3N88_34805 [Mikania micrantha]